MSPASQSPPTKKKPSWLLGFLVFLCVLGAFLIALFGAWVGTTLAVYKDGPVWLAVVGAVVCFAVIPLVWELWADKDQVGGRVRDAILRSSFLSLAFVTILVATHPKVTFEALATRGDWFLGGDKSGGAETIRSILRTAANGLEWLNNLARPKEFRLDPNDPDQLAAEQEKPVPPPPAESRGLEKLAIPGTAATWPMPAVVHPIVSAMPDDAKASIASVGKYLRANITDPFERVKAIHDFVASWVEYDGVALLDGSYRDLSYDAGAVFARKKSVCEGYSRLTVALGKATGDKIIYLSGDARQAKDYDKIAAGAFDGAASDVGHAWNAVEIAGQWYLLDVTWDAGHLNGTAFVRNYKTTYLFIPPEVMILDHRPDQERYQLLAAPIDRATFLRQPLLEPDGVGFGLSIVDPKEPIVTASGALVVNVANPGNNWVSLGIDATGSGVYSDCGASTNDKNARLTCTLTNEGRAVARLFANQEQYGEYDSVYSVLVDAKP